MIIIMEMDKVMNLSIRLNVHICVLISFSASATGHGWMVRRLTWSCFRHQRMVFVNSSRLWE